MTWNLPEEVGSGKENFWQSTAYPDMLMCGNLLGGRKGNQSCTQVCNDSPARCKYLGNTFICQKAFNQGRLARCDVRRLQISRQITEQRSTHPTINLKQQKQQNTAMQHAASAPCALPYWCWKQDTQGSRLHPHHTEYRMGILLSIELHDIVHVVLVWHPQDASTCTVSESADKEPDRSRSHTHGDQIPKPA